MSVHVIDTIKPKNGLSFPIVEDIDILITDSGKRLSEIVATMATQAMIEALQLAIASKASQSDLEALQATVSGKASQADLTALAETVSNKASTADLVALEAEVDTKADSSALATAAANLQAQIDNLVTPVTQDAEVQNARVDAEGISHATLKQRIDSTEAKANSNALEISGIISKNYANKEYTNESTYSQTYNGYFDESGFNENSAFTSYLVPIEKNTTIYCNSHNSAYFSICVYNSASLTSGTRYRYVSGGEDTLPDNTDPVSLSAGQYIVFSVRNEYPTFSVTLTNYTLTAKLLDNTVSLNSAQLNQVVSTVDDSFAPIDSNYINATYTNSSNYEHTYNGYCSNEGITESASYISYSMQASKNTTIYCNSYNNSYFSICISDTPTFVGCTRYRFVNGGENTLPDVNNPVSITAGQYICFTTNVTNTLFSVTLTSYTLLKTLDDSISLNTNNINQVISALGEEKKCYVKYNDSDASGIYTESLDIYIPTGVGYIRYNFAHGISNAINANIWHMRNAYAVDDSFVDRFALTTTGEWECAIKPVGAPDFAGGMTHGDQVMSGIWCFVDGEKVNITTLDMTAFKTLKIVETSTLYNPSDSSAMATVGSEHIWDDKELTINQALEWNLSEELHILNAYMAMHLPAKAITDHYYTDNTFVPITCASNYGTIMGVHKSCVYGDTSGISTEFDISEYPTGYTGSGKFLITDNGGSSYNKCYYSIVMDGNDAIPSGKTLWKASSHYKFDIGK